MMGNVVLETPDPRNRAPFESPAASRHFLTIGRKMGISFLLVAGSLVLVCGVVLHDTSRVRNDAARLVEETREAELGTELLAAVERATQLAMVATSSGSRSKLLAQLRTARAAGNRLIQEAPGGDPSEPGHEETENKLIHKIRDNLAAAESRLSTPGTVGAQLKEALTNTRDLAAVLEQAMRLETQQANRDLQSRVEQVNRAMLAATAGSSILLLLVLWLVYRNIVLPLRMLREGSERIGRGELSHRIWIRSRDEIGDLAMEFNRMASLVSKSHAELEAKVRKRTREFIQAAKFAGLGTLAAGVAHEINNPIASIASCAEGLERRVQAGEIDRDEQIDYLQTIAGEAYRVHEITAQLLEFGRQDPGPRAAIEAVDLLSEVELIVRHRFEQNRIALVIDIAPDLPRIHGNASELKQVMLNLLINASDASKPGDRVRLRARRNADQVILEVADQGEGIPTPQRERIFDPFYTTKDPGQGTGLGLALAYRIVESHGGRIELEDAAEGGSLFQVVLPASNGAAA